MDKFVAFTTTIYRSKIENLNLKDIAQEIFDYQLQDDGVKMSNRGGWQSTGLNYPIPMGEKSIPSIEKIVDAILPAIVESFLDYGLKQEEYFIHYWLNVNGKYNYNKTHSHGDSKMSAVLYIKVPSNSGNIIFERTDTMIHDFDIENANNFDSFYIEPYEGVLIVFPSQLKHHVEQNLTNDKDDRRVSIAFNIR